MLVVESLALGIDRWKPVILEKLKKVLAEDGISIRGVYERSDARVRLQEGMERFKGFIGDSFDTKVEIVENGVRYMVDVQDGQKTGFFLDQKYNRLAIQRLCKGKRVLDCFTHTGSFALNAGIAGASEVLGVDASELGVAQAAENAALNGLSDRVRFVAADVFDLLPELERQGEKFDVVILDPPAFTKSRNSVKNAVKGYREINLRGMKLVKDGGYLATCSCSHFMTPELFAKTIREAAGNVHKRLRQVEYRTQAADHPILWGDSESSYLKFFIFQVCDENKRPADKPEYVRALETGRHMAQPASSARIFTDRPSFHPRGLPLSGSDGPPGPCFPWRLPHTGSGSRRWTGSPCCSRP